MPRIARVVVENYPHHIIQRGNRRQQVFFQDKDYTEYLKLLKQNSEKYKTEISTYCLMPNHVHLIATPLMGGNLSLAIAETHRNYTRYINFRENWKGYLWQGRFSSYVLNEKYLLSAVRYILLNPVKAKITKDAQDYNWSSLKYHTGKKRGGVINDGLLQKLINDWEDYLVVSPNDSEIKLLQIHERTGRPLGDDAFLDDLEKILGRDLRRKKPGPKRKR